ncbi:hypothetical protein TcCL_NonESM12181 [Trypanosoma cruzi]|nr:hypothetical protein TcCL_NonESM12181 [Trypanosoma cruzi]
MDCAAYVTLLGYPTTTFAPLAQHRIFPWDTVSCSGVRFYQPLLAEDASDDVGRTALDSIYSSLGAYGFELWTDGPSYLAELPSGSAALLYGSTTTNDLPVEVHCAATGSLACSYRADCPAIKNGFRHLIPFLFGKIPIAHTNLGGNGLLLGDGVTPPWPAGGARRRQREDFCRAAFTGGLRSRCWLHISP